MGTTVDSVLDMPLATLTWQDPWHWLKLGWADFLRAPLIGLFYGQQMGYAEIARVTGLREGTVKSRLSRARAALEKKLAASE